MSRPEYFDGNFHILGNTLDDALKRLYEIKPSELKPDDLGVWSRLIDISKKINERTLALVGAASSKDKPLNKKAKKEYLEDLGNTCPYCGNDDCCKQDYSDIDGVESGDLEQRRSCDECGRKWIDVFKLIDIREIA